MIVLVGSLAAAFAGCSQGEAGEETERAEGPDPAGGGPRLENYEDQPDMTAEEAAAVLEAVVNLERQQRRDRAAERARSQARGGKDW